MDMSISHVSSFALVLMCALVHFSQSLEYRDLEKLGIACPKRDKCAGYRNDASYLDRSCECDSACHTYKDCCIDVRRRPSGQRASPTNMMCLNYGESEHSGVYAVSKCSNNWNGPKEVKQRCEGSPDFSDPVSAAPVTSASRAVTYKNLFCAECNNADMGSLKLFQFKLSCEGVTDSSQEQIIRQLTYNKQKKVWGVNRVDAERNSVFSECQIFFDLPSYLNRSVRFCRANIISKCARNWTRPQVKKSCDEYMAVVFDKVRAYRNPHCAICNHKTIPDLSCSSSLLGRKRPISFSTLIDINPKDDSVSQCPTNQLYDPYFKKCRQLHCALPGYVLENGKCVPGS